MSGLTISKCGCEAPPPVCGCVSAFASTSAATLSVSRVRDRILADDCDGRRIAAAHARRAQNTNLMAEKRRQPAEQTARTGDLAGDGVANAYCDCGGRRLSVLHDVEVMVERGDLVDFRHRQFHLRGKRHEMMRRDAAETVLNPMQDALSADPGGEGSRREAQQPPRVLLDRRGGP